MHVINGLKELVHVIPHQCLGQVMVSSTDAFIDVHIHQLKNYIKRLVTRVENDLNKLDNVRVSIQAS